jgi:phosphoribosylglycinamide formyltransferase-1
MSANLSNPFPLVVLLSGEGSNLQAILDRIADGTVPAQIVAVISNRADAPGIARARHAGIATHIHDPRQFPDRSTYDRELIMLIDRYAPKLVVLAGFMRILTSEFVQYYHGRLINIHPSLLPKYKGLRTHQRAIEAGETEHGATVHYVTAELDSGPIILQSSIPIFTTDTAASLEQRVHHLEHQLYPEVIRRMASGDVQLRGDTVYLANKPLTSAQRLYSPQV